MGHDTVLTAQNLIGIFDLDSVTVQKDSRNFVNTAQKRGEIVDLTTDLPVSFVLCDGEEQGQKVYLSSFSLTTLYTHVKRQFP